MQSIHLTKQEKFYLQTLLHQEIISVDVPLKNVPVDKISPLGLPALKITFQAGKTIFFGVKSINLAEGIEVFCVDINLSLDIRQSRNGQQVDWYPLVALSEDVIGSKVTDIRLLNATWKLSVDNSENKVTYGRNPRSLNYDLPAEQATCNVEDGVMLFLSNGRVLIISAMSELNETLKIMLAG